MLPLINIWHTLGQGVGIGAQEEQGMRSDKLADRLDWNELLGFEQIVENRASIRSMSADHRLGAKVGPKPTAEGSPKIGSKIGLKTGEKPVP